MRLFLQGALSTSTKGTAMLMAKECASQCRAILAGRMSCDWYDEQGELGPMTIG